MNSQLRPGNSIHANAYAANAAMAIGMIVAVPILAVGRVLVKRLYVERVLEGGGFHPILSDEPIVITVPEAAGLSLGPDAERSVPGMLEVLDA